MLTYSGTTTLVDDQNIVQRKIAAQSTHIQIILQEIILSCPGKINEIIHVSYRLQYHHIHHK